ncbi:MAG: alanine--tRNA ligase [Bacteroidetes bacterium]|nr:MAG: alanine--tRNA ligase [Bacteroidota bacterium]
MTSQAIRKAFLEFFETRGHHVVPSAPMVLKNDPTLMFSNAGMNQFKDFFLGNKESEYSRIADTQKCLRVTGKHNDLEEVGHDTYHHTMFEMLGNWSFGDYFKEDAISWGWEFLTGKLGLEADRMYVTVFEGDEKDGLERDSEAAECWKKHLPEARILDGCKKDNFWEMGDTGPCGPCSEIHIDLRNDPDRRAIDGADLVNKDHPQVIEIWNLVFIQFNRKSDGSLESLPEKHVDTGMGFERLCMAMQGKQSNYDTDLFQPLIKALGEKTGTDYGENEAADIAMRVVSDHLRAIAFSIADGQLPSNNKAGYVIRRILRRAVRYGYTYLSRKEAFIHELVPVLIEIMGGTFPELDAQKELITKVIREEEQAFLATLETGISLLDQLSEKAEAAEQTLLSGKDAFTLYDTFGFPLDLTELILAEKGMSVDREAFEKEMEAQKNRSRKDAERESGDWIVLEEDDKEEFVGYDWLETEVRITRYREITRKKKTYYQLVLNLTPFYAESGGQIGDKGVLENDREQIEIIDTVKENELILHLSTELPKDPTASFQARVDQHRRLCAANNHTATHLMHHALREVLGSHVEQKGSLVEPGYLRFDFSHFQKMSAGEIRKVEHRVNEMIRLNSKLDERRSVPMHEARNMGAVALFGEKYGDTVRVIRFGDSIELCGGTHAKSTGQIGSFRILKESSIAAGIRRIEAITGEAAEEYIDARLDTMAEINGLFEKQKDLVRAIRSTLEDNSRLSKAMEAIHRKMLAETAARLESDAEDYRGFRLNASIVKVENAGQLRDLAFQLKSKDPDLALILGAETEGKANLAILLPSFLHAEKGLNAAQMIREVAKSIQGGGGGQPFFATAGGKNPAGLEAAISAGRRAILEALGQAE